MAIPCNDPPWYKPCLLLADHRVDHLFQPTYEDFGEDFVVDIQQRDRPVVAYVARVLFLVEQNARSVSKWLGSIRDLLGPIYERR